MHDEYQNISIPVVRLLDEFTCPICFEFIKECRITPCGHNFCDYCIKECLNLKHVCPVCNADCVVDTLVHNRQFDSILEIVSKEKEKSSNQYFDTLINHDNDSGGQKFTPVETLFQSYMKKSLGTFQEYYKELEEKNEQSKEEIRRYYDKKMEAYKKKSGKSEGRTIDKIVKRCDKRLEECEEKFQLSTDLLLKSYEDYLKNITPAPQYLPVNVILSIPSKGKKFSNIRVNRADTVLTIRDIFISEMERIDPIDELGDDCHIVLVNSFHNEIGDEIMLDSEYIPILQYNPINNCTIELRGTVICKSDTPKKCFKNEFKEGALMDYFACADCKLNWICLACSETCHVGHNLVPYIKDHTATWACCYCPKSRKCKLYKN
eukprot:TRINITY_DN6460_c0_g1_i1.p1 TRINITY_DN6460_c0_g1~~TRINITY_DN6460_c0_g1_i1.p1  ORF type:complete len:377 (-),score=62.83 TRINITY_DN6460_c0_g1_i1:9-1139(-)